MQYLGGKTRIAKPIADAILAHTVKRGMYIEPFVGGASVAARLVPEFNASLLADTQQDLVLLWRAVLAGWVPPDTLTEAEYGVLRTGEPSPLRAFAGFGCSFGGKWFGGYARPAGSPNYAATAQRSIIKKAKALRGATILCSDYRDLTAYVDSDTVVYCDPPYAGTTGYDGAGTFDTDTFWDNMRVWREAGASVYVSELIAPPDWQPIWYHTRPRKVSATTGTLVEQLFV